MADVRVFWEGNTTPCPECGHDDGVHGFATSGCSRIGAGGWCECQRIPEHPALLDGESDEVWTCVVCGADLDVSIVHASELS